MEIAWQIIAVLGGLQVILAGLIGFLGKVWATRISNDQKAALTRLENDQKAAFDSQLTLMKDELTRKRDLTATERERVVSHFEKTMNAYAELLVLVRLANRHHWLFSQELVDLERASIKAFYGLSVQLQILRSIEAVPLETAAAASGALFQVRDAWDQLIFHLGQYKTDLKQDSTYAQDTWKRVAEAARVLHERTSPLEKFMESIPAAVRIPR